MKTVSIPYPEGLPQSLKLSDSEFADEMLSINIQAEETDKETDALKTLK